MCVLDSVEATIKYLGDAAPPPNIIFIDIHASDGISLEIFRKVPMDVPVILTTAYSQYSIKAFEINSIDYLLKPIKREDLKKVLQKYQRIEGRRMIPIAASDFSYFEARGGVAQGVSFDGKILLMEDNLEKLMECLDPNQFYRANCQFLVNPKSIQYVEYYFNGRLLLKTMPANDENILVSKAKAGEFKAWMSEL